MKRVRNDYPSTRSKDRIFSNGTARRKDGSATTQEGDLSKSEFAISFLFGTRGVNRPWQTKNVPRFASALYNPALSLPPTRSQFLIRRFITVVLSFLILDIGTFHPLDPKLFDLATIPFFARLWSGRITLDEIGVRVTNTLANWVMNYAFICFFANCWACLVVGVGLSKPEAWPPGFGALSDAWTLRRCWG